MPHPAAIEEATVERLDVVAGIIVHEGRVLACRRKPDRSAGGRWEFPGGKIESDEEPRDALVREIREELGVEVTAGRRLTVDDTAVDGRLIRLICMWAHAVAEIPSRSTDHDVLRWLSRSELESVEWAEPDLPAVRLLADRWV